MELLKEITIEGFKSFRDKTVLKFDGPFTAIVGPNGSGKSNVVDAIKWVLGDQSPRSIRASSGQEAIYRPVDSNGQNSEPAGFASVCLKIDNSDSDIPDEPSMWEIERRYYRSGESIYSLNGKTARLKDIRAVMARKGFGLGSLSVVGQGEVDGFLSLVPTDRRLVFEDLARISDFKANKRKILNQLEECGRNMERMGDLLREITARADVLSVQAVSARRHAELTKSANDIRSKLAAQQYILALRNLERNITSLDEIRNEQGQARISEEDSAGILRECKAALENAREEVSAILADCQRERRELDGARAEERRLQDSCGHYAEFIRTLEGEVSERITRVETIISRQEELTGTVESARNESISAGRWRAEYDMYLSRLSGFIRACGKERERLASRVEKLQGEGSLFARDREFHSKRAESLGAEISELEQLELDVLEEIDMLDVDIVNYSVSNHDLSGRKNVLDEILKKDTRLLQDLDGARKKIEERRIGVNGQIELARKEYALLNELEASREGYDEGVIAIVNRKEEFPGLAGSLGELITVAPGMENFIERALGDALQFLVVDTVASALGIIEFARKQKSGIITCIVKDLVLPAGETDSGDIADACSINPEYRGLLDLFLRGIQKVDKIDESSLQNCAIVASDGSVFRPPAFISGGPGIPQAKGILTRRARLNEIEKHLVYLKWERARLESENHRQSTETATILHRINRLRVDADSLISAIAENESRLDRSREQSRTKTTHVIELKNRQRELKAERKSCLDAAEFANVESQLVRKIKADAEDSLAAIDKRIAGFSGKAEDLRSRLQRALVTEASYREESERARAEISRLGRELQESIDAAERKKERLESARSEAASANEACASAKQGREKLERRIPELEERESSSSKVIEYRKQLLTDAEEKREAARERIEEFAERVHNQEVRVAELRGSLTGYEKDLEEYPDLAEKIRSGELAGKDIPSKKELTSQLEEYVAELEELGEVNPLAIEEEVRARARVDEISKEQVDLEEAQEELRAALAEVERESEKAFVSTFEAARERFSEVFCSLFPGGKAMLGLTDPENPLESGIDVKVRFPGKGELDLLQFSGGERSLIALALLFAILKVKPSSFTLLDEVEAALDDVNTQKFLDYLSKEFNERQFILITHNKITMERANRLYGVTMLKGGVSQVVSVDLQNLKGREYEEMLGVPN